MENRNTAHARSECEAPASHCNIVRLAFRFWWHALHVPSMLRMNVDDWLQTETGSVLITGLPGAWAMKPGCASLPFFGVRPVLLDDKVSHLAQGTKDRQ